MKAMSSMTTGPRPVRMQVRTPRLASLGCRCPNLNARVKSAPRWRRAAEPDRPNLAMEDTPEEPSIDTSDVLGDLMPVGPNDAQYDDDSWEGEQWEWLGFVMENFLPLVVVLGMGIGGIAATFYNQGATVLVTPAQEDRPARAFVVDE
ncbi:hypothetical protein BSKO_06333 [Bryopsis sp. KO-2023]|nr:hypothetical protein BSKO_06333 [Bryopsis sp. KO-2023]